MLQTRYVVEIYKSADNEYRWRMKSINGKIVADSGEGYSRKDSAINAVRKFTRYLWCTVQIKHL
jgi:uncharacterized protein YegP (UPF0339 family)